MSAWIDGLIPWLRERVAERERHVSAFNPSRLARQETLADCHAKKMIIGWCAEVIKDRDLSGYGRPGALKDDPDALAVTLAVETLRVLALVYQHHPGYREAWRPS